MDFDKIFMDSNSRRILKAASSGEIVYLHEVNAQFLLSLGFISEYALSRCGSEYVITGSGLRYEEYISKKEAELCRQELAERKRDLRGWITTTIAFLALILSLFSLLWQTYTWKAEKSALPESKSTAATTMAAHALPSSQAAGRFSARSP